jgi:hypothetical protein
MSILDLSDQPAWYAVRVSAERHGTKGYLGVRYQWSKPKYLNNFDALKFAYDMKPSPSSVAGVQTFYDAELYQWNGTRWTKIA